MELLRTDDFVVNKTEKVKRIPMIPRKLRTNKRNEVGASRAGVF